MPPPAKRQRKARHAAGRLRPADYALLIAAAVNLAAGVWVSLQSDRLSDFAQVAGWLRQWYIGVDSYAAPSVTDYPPWALVVLSPLNAIPAVIQPLFWVGVNVGLAIVLAVHLVRLTGGEAMGRPRLLALLLLAACIRTLNQFSLFAYVVALAGATLHCGVIGGLILGTAMIKPQVAGAVALWAVLSGRVWRVVLAAIVPLMLSMFYAERLLSTARTVLTEYAVVLQRIYGGRGFTGHTDLKAWVEAVWPAFPGGFGFTIALALLLVTPALVAVGRRRGPLDRDLELLAFCGVVSLLAVRHLSYDFILVLPVLAAWATTPKNRTAGRWDNALKVFFVMVAVWLLLNPSGVARRVFPAIGMPDVLTAIALQIDRLMCLLLWIVMSVRLVTRYDRPDRKAAAAIR